MVVAVFDIRHRFSMSTGKLINRSHLFRQQEAIGFVVNFFRLPRREIPLSIIHCETEDKMVDLDTDVEHLDECESCGKKWNESYREQMSMPGEI